ncbi:MAG: UvrD-helicase domain-containing protein [Pirellulaceae bacterium]|jgi:DNA helicase-2/ATP-dependent DNA helicase PcrA|nr:UvrD-helicase domain-containing protein [Pirellulaceae bacterium]
MPGLNPPQQQAVSTLSGPLLVLAGAGTGKTRVVTFRIANLIRNGTPPERILGVTFTNKAAGEMQERVGELLRKSVKTRPQICTFHSYCVQMLRRHIKRLGYPNNFPIYSRGDQESLARRVLQEIRSPQSALRQGDLLYFIGHWKARGIRPAAAARLAQTDREHLAASAYRRYQRMLQQLGAVDFDDILLLAEDLLNKNDEVRGEESERFQHILVDEYQDTNRTQYHIIAALAEEHRNLCVVGDDDQSIYAWRGAEVEHILRFKQDWPDATVVKLEQNYRSTAEILDLSNRLIGFNKVRHEKTLEAARSGGPKPRIEQYVNEQVEAEEVVAAILRRSRRSGLDFRDFAVLFRTNEQPRLFEQELRRNNVPYVLLGSKSFFDRREIKELTAYLRVVAYPKDEVSLRMILNSPPRGIGSRAMEKLLAAKSDSSTLWDVLADPPAISRSAQRGVKEFRDLIASLRAKTRPRLAKDLVSSLLQRIHYDQDLERVYKTPTELEQRRSAIGEFQQSYDQFLSRSNNPKLRAFIDELTLADRDFENDKDSQLGRNAVALITLHSAKGLEYPEVYMVGMEDGVLPHKRSIEDGDGAIEEERRLCYVGLTRAQERLTLSFALTRLKWGKPRPTIPSQFLFEMTGQRRGRKKKSAGKQRVDAGRTTSTSGPTKTNGPPKKKRKKSPRSRRPRGS